MQQRASQSAWACIIDINEQFIDLGSTEFGKGSVDLTLILSEFLRQGIAAVAKIPSRVHPAEVLSREDDSYRNTRS